jgi:hypothetical protein
MCGKQKLAMSLVLEGASKIYAGSKSLVMIQGCGEYRGCSSMILPASLRVRANLLRRFACRPGIIAS